MNTFNKEGHFLSIVKSLTALHCRPLSAPVCLSKTDLPRNSAAVSNSANTNLTVQMSHA